MPASKKSAVKTRPAISRIIQEEHEQVRELFEQFEEDQKGQGHNAQDLGTQITTELKGHIKREEKLVYPTLKQMDEDLFREAHQEHHVANVLIEELKTLGARSVNYAAKMKVLHEGIEHHMEEEHTKMFSTLRKAPAKALREMAEGWRAMK